MVLVLFSPPPIFFEEDVSRVAVVRVKKVGGGPLAVAVALQPHQPPQPHNNQWPPESSSHVRLLLGKQSN